MVKRNRDGDLFSILLKASDLVQNLLYAGVAWGAVAGYFGMATASGELAVAKNSASLFMGLLVVLPVTLIFQIKRAVRGTAHDQFFAVPVRAYTLLAITGLAGGLGGVLGFIVSASIIPTIFKKVESNDYLRTEIGIVNVVVIIVVTFLAGLGLARWATGAKRPGQKIS